MRKALPSALLLASSFLTAAAGCSLVSSDPEDESSNPATTAGSAGTGIAVGKGGTGGTDGEAGAGGSDGTVTAPGCDTLVGLDKCGTTSVEAEYRTANIMLVIDKSKSMVDQPTGFDTDKWTALKSALNDSL